MLVSPDRFMHSKAAIGNVSRPTGPKVPSLRHIQLPQSKGVLRSREGVFQSVFLQRIVDYTIEVFQTITEQIESFLVKRIHNEVFWSCLERSECSRKDMSN